MFNKIYYLGNTDIEDPKDEKAIHKLMADMSAVSYFLYTILYNFKSDLVWL